MANTPAKTSAPPAPKTLEEHRQYLQDFTRLQLWFVDHWARKQSAEDVPTILQKRVDIQRKTIFHTGHVDGRMAPDLATNPQWLRLTKELTDLQARIESTQQNAEQKVAQKKEELYTPLLEKADKAIKDVAQEKGYDYIFDVSVGAVLYAKPTDDILPLVKAKMGLK